MNYPTAVRHLTIVNISLPVGSKLGSNEDEGMGQGRGHVPEPDNQVLRAKAGIVAAGGLSKAGGLLSAEMPLAAQRLSQQTVSI